ncbi:uncharacterized protein MEPE_02206 [Melanopsichium pennsylvanicum]|uniref:Uncharacterized protein n=2 Tax=Melanopsichium pennsylvanicum TaxID=63383 RepID=A0AAJ4XIY9_9BASI|nr:hypothetical protein BN887_05408 [Melanopsichium pennsylvanicum 4]SNX83499.1 uncharacterized protein MEPE_02206 [Melanopsichium pennsylvanicum]
MMKLFTLFAGILWLMSGVSYALPGPVADMNHVPGGSQLWNMVTNMRRFPGHRHANNVNDGVTAEWKDYLTRFADVDIHSAFPHLQQALQAGGLSEDQASVWAGQTGERPNDVLAVAEEKDQWLARHLVNTYINRRYADMQHAQNLEMRQAVAAARAARRAAERAGVRAAGGVALRFRVGDARQNAEELSVNGPPRSPSSTSDDEGTASSYW